MENILKVKSDSDSSKLAGMIANIITGETELKVKDIELHCIGAGAVNQGVKAIAIARGYVAPAGINLICIPAFTNITFEGEQRTAMKLIVREEK